MLKIGTLDLARQLGVEPRFVPVRMADVPLRAPRPQYCALSNEKLLAAGIRCIPTHRGVLAHTKQITAGLA